MICNVHKMQKSNLWPMEMYDRYGHLIDRLIVECDTETGRVVSYQTNEKGFIIVKRRELATQEEFFPAPLTGKILGDKEAVRRLTFNSKC